jgi:hypothetical protein
MRQTTLTFILLALYQLKHYLADYRFQTAYMLGKLKEEGWEVPLLAHVSVHAAMTLVIAVGVCWFRRLPFGFAVFATMFDFYAHFTVDRLKANLSRDAAMNEPRFWRLLGMDQMAHHLTHYLIIYALVHI